MHASSAAPSDRDVLVELAEIDDHGGVPEKCRCLLDLVGEGGVHRVEIARDEAQGT